MVSQATQTQQSQWVTSIPIVRARPRRHIARLVQLKWDSYQGTESIRYSSHQKHSAPRLAVPEMVVTGRPSTFTHIVWQTPLVEMSIKELVMSWNGQSFFKSRWIPTSWAPTILSSSLSPNCSTGHMTLKHSWTSSATLPPLLPEEARRYCSELKDCQTRQVVARAPEGESPYTILWGSEWPIKMYVKNDVIAETEVDSMRLTQSATNTLI